MNKKYELTNDTRQIENKTIYRIKALRDFSNVKAGDVGGFVGSEKNLSHDGDCWVYGDAAIYSDASVIGNAQVSQNSLVSGSAIIDCDARVYGWARVYELAHISDSAHISSQAVIRGEASIKGNAIIHGYALIDGQAYVHDSALVSGYSKIGGFASICGTVRILSTMSPIISGVFSAGVIDQLNKSSQKSKPVNFGAPLTKGAFNGKEVAQMFNIDPDDSGISYNQYGLPLEFDTTALGCDHVEMSFPMQIKEKGMSHWYCCKKCGEAVREFSVDK